MRSNEIIIVDSSDDNDSEGEREFDWEPTKTNGWMEDNEQVDSTLDFPDSLHSFRCPIGHCVMRDPVILSDGHSYERAHIVRWLAEKTTSPMTGRNLDDVRLTPNLNLRHAIAEWLEKLAEKEREDATMHERESDQAAKVQEEKTREIRAREAEEASRVAAIEAEVAARVEALRVMVARVEAHTAARVREAEEAARVASLRVKEADEAAICATARAEEMAGVKSVQSEAAARVDPKQVVVTRVNTETKIVNEHHVYQRVYKICSVPNCSSYARGYGV